MKFFNDEAATVSRERISFSFGENWKKYLSGVEEANIKRAENSFTAFTRLSRLNAHTFLDVGCGSGLSSLVAYRLGVKRESRLTSTRAASNVSKTYARDLLLAQPNGRFYKGQFLTAIFSPHLGVSPTSILGVSFITRGQCGRP